LPPYFYIAGSGPHILAHNLLDQHLILPGPGGHLKHGRDEQQASEDALGGLLLSVRVLFHNQLENMPSQPSPQSTGLAVSESETAEE
jgi:hypothetical protein